MRARKRKAYEGRRTRDAGAAAGAPGTRDQPGGKRTQDQPGNSAAAGASPGAGARTRTPRAAAGYRVKSVATRAIAWRFTTAPAAT